MGDKTIRAFTAYIEYDPETKQCVGNVPGLLGAHTQAETLDELQANLREVVELCMEEYRDELDNM